MKWVKFLKSFNWNFCFVLYLVLFKKSGFLLRNLGFNEKVDVMVGYNFCYFRIYLVIDFLFFLGSFVNLFCEFDYLSLVEWKIFDVKVLFFKN